MSFNNHHQQFQRQLQQQEQRRQQAAWALQQEKKRKRRDRMARFQQDEFDSGDVVGSGSGIHIQDSDNLNVGRDMIGGNKYNSSYYPRDEKNGYILFIERAFVFIVTLGVVGAVAIGAVVRMAPENPIFIVIAAIGALLFAVVNTSQVSRYRD